MLCYWYSLGQISYITILNFSSCRCWIRRGNKRPVESWVLTSTILGGRLTDLAIPFRPPYLVFIKGVHRPAERGLHAQITTPSGFWPPPPALWWSEFPAQKFPELYVVSWEGTHPDIPKGTPKLCPSVPFSPELICQWLQKAHSKNHILKYGLFSLPGFHKIIDSQL